MNYLMQSLNDQRLSVDLLLNSSSSHEMWIDLTTVSPKRKGLADFNYLPFTGELNHLAGSQGD